MASLFATLAKECESVAYDEALRTIAGNWYIKDVEKHVELELLMPSLEVRSKEPRFGGKVFVGKPRAGLVNFEMDAEIGGFPMVASMKKKTGDSMLLFSSGMVWTKDSPLKIAPKSGSTKTAVGIPMSEVKKHTTKDSAWVVLFDKVYDLTEFIADHPGGEEVILQWAGKDATKFWKLVHKEDWIKEYTKPEWCLGPVGPEVAGGDGAESQALKDEIQALKAEIARLTEAPTKPSKGLQDAIGAAAAGKTASASMTADKPPEAVAEPDRIVLKGRRILVVGHGPVGHDFIVKLVGMVGDGALDITIIGEEPRMAYDRVHLTEYFEHRDASKLSMCDQKWFQTHKVGVRTNAQVTKIYREAHEIGIRDTKTGKVETMQYDACVLATGSYPFVPPLKNLSTDIVGVFVYRTIEDLEGMVLYAKKAKRCAVIGGGLLGLEAAKAAYDLGMETHVLEMAPYLMPTQLEEGGGKALQRKIVDLGILVHTGVRMSCIETEHGAMKGVRMTDSETPEEALVEFDMLVVSAGVRARDELARECGLAIGARGGVVVDSRMRSSDSDIYAIGEVACYGGLCYGLIAPGWDQATVLAKNFEDATWGCKGSAGTSTPHGEPPLYEGSDLSTKLKLLGVDVASFGSSLDFWFKRQFHDAEAQKQGLTSTLQADPFSGLYRKLVFDKETQKLMGGLLVGNADDYFSLLGLSKQIDLGNKQPQDLFLGGSGGEQDVDDLSDDAIVCLCQKVTKKDIVDAVKDQDCCTIPDLKRATTAGSGCGGCILNTGFIPKLLKGTLESCGKKMFTGISPLFPFTRPELFQIIKVKQLKTWEEVVETCAREGKIPDLKKAMAGDEVCKPVVASILASLWQENPNKDGLKQLQDTNDHMLANIQRSGQYSVIPRCPGGEITADELILLGTVAKKYNLWTKVTGAQRIGLFGANMWQLPEIWEDIVYGKSSVKSSDGKVEVKVETEGMESGHAYGKALRAVKTCVGTSWCRFGVLDSVGMGARIEQRYKGFRAPHKWKMGVSGCMRECAEAQGKDIGLVAANDGWNLYICGNHGTSPKHATLFLSGLNDDDAIKYIDRVMMYYTYTSAPLTRTSKWLENLEGGIEHLREVVVDDKLGLCAELDERMQSQVNTYACEWKTVVDTPELRKKYRQFVNVDDKKYGDLEWERSRKQHKIKVEDLPTVIGPAKISKEKADSTWTWRDLGAAEDYNKGGGIAAKVSNTELAVFYHVGMDKWYATQNSCPHKQLQVLSRGLIGLQGEIPKIACPIHKNTYNLETGKGISNAGLNIATFDAKVEGGRVMVHLPPDEVLDKALAREDPKGNCGGGCELPKDLQW